MNAIVAVDANWGIGKDGALLLSIPEDMKFFRETTQGKTVIMGRKTLASFPGGKPLKNRRNIVLTCDAGFACEGAEIVHSVEEALALVTALPSEDVFIIGGASVYAAFLPYCRKAYVTKMYYTFDADTHFPNLDDDPAWKVAKKGGELYHENIAYQFLTYRRRKEI